MKVTVWNENIHEKEMPIVTENYPGGIHGYIKTAKAFRNQYVQQILKNAVRWACPIRKNIEITCPEVPTLEE